MNQEHPFQGRTVAVIEDLNRQERMYLYDQTRRLKEALHTNNTGVVDQFRIDDQDFGIYEVFLEDSTRTRESFKNAAHFHRAKFSEFFAASSSFNKSESYSDTFANLSGYQNQIFIVRSNLEGVCRYLEEATEQYRQRNHLPNRVSFINAGDGRHEHPTQELLDEFTFLEDLNWSAEHIHLALVGDLYHGRTVHSKVHGLNLFKTVTVDLIAPEELSMPQQYQQQMMDQGFTVRQFSSIEEYLANPAGVAGQWYFTRPQIERMGERVRRREEELRRAITFEPVFMDNLPGHTTFYHPLPRHREHPTIPTALDSTPLNGWERQSANGYLVRIVLLAMLAGKIGSDYHGPRGTEETEPEECLEYCAIDRTSPHTQERQYSEGIRPIRDGLVIDHICAGDTPEEIRSHLATLISVMALHGRGGEWVSTGSDSSYKGILFRPDHPTPDESMLRKLAAVVPGATVNVIAQGSVQQKIRVHSPERIQDLPELICRNPACITHPDNREHIIPRFRRSFGLHHRKGYVCEYCSTFHTFQEIWR